MKSILLDVLRMDRLKIKTYRLYIDLRGYPPKFSGASFKIAFMNAYFHISLLHSMYFIATFLSCGRLSATDLESVKALLNVLRLLIAGIPFSKADSKLIMIQILLFLRIFSVQMCLLTLT